MFSFYRCVGYCPTSNRVIFLGPSLLDLYLILSPETKLVVKVIAPHKLEFPQHVKRFTHAHYTSCQANVFCPMSSHRSSTCPLQYKYTICHKRQSRNEVSYQKYVSSQMMHKPHQPDGRFAVASCGLDDNSIEPKRNL